jgi:ADP-heptose:LPS heptosyltransferase
MNNRLFRYFPLTVSSPFLFIYLKLLSCFFFFIRKKNKETQGVKKILLVQLAHLGDVILLRRCIASVQQRYPEALIGVLIGSWSQGLFEDSQEIRQHVFDHWKLSRSPDFFRKIKTCISSFFSSYTSIKEAKYDMSIDLSLFYPNSHLFTWLVNIPERAGFFSGGCGELLTKRAFVREKILPIEEELQNLFDLVEIKLQKKHPRHTKKDVWIFHPCSGNKGKDLSENFWKGLLLFFKAHGKKVVFTGKSAKENTFINKILEDESITINLCGKLSLPEIEQLVSTAKGVVCVDTFIAHMASCYHQRIFVQFNHPLHMIRWKPQHAYGLCHQLECDHENNYFSRWLWNKTLRKNSASS